MIEAGKHRISIVTAVLLLLLCAGPAAAQQRYSSIRIPLSDAVDVEAIARLGFPLEEARVKPGHSIEIWTGEEERRLLEREGIAYTVLIADWNAHYAERIRANHVTSTQSMPYSRAEHFHLGGMGGHLTLEELYAELDLMRTTAPSLLSRNDTIGVTHEGRPIIAVRLTASTDSAAPEVLYTALHHAREPEGMMALVYFMWHLIEQYPENEEIRKLLDRAALCFIPVVNPDGYEYNRAIKPQGGGMWRKNRKPCGPAFGVDLNRNYGFSWAYDNSGSSPDSSTETYRGKSAFSEAETSAIRDYCNRRRFSKAVNYHTYGNLLIFPWGYRDRLTADSLVFRMISERLTAHNRYTWGTSRQTLNYLMNGNSDDWMYGDTVSHRPIFAFTQEIGNYKDNFWTPPSRILQLADLQLEANLLLAHMAVPSVRIASAVLSDDAAAVNLSLDFEGSTAAGRIDSIRLSVNGPLLVADPLITGIPYPPPLPLTVHLLRIGSAAWYGARARVDVTISTDESTIRDSVLFRIGSPRVLFADGAEQGEEAWITQGEWGRQACEKARGGFCFTESPAGNYRNYDSSSLLLRQPLDLRSCTAAELSFETRWRIESANDYGSVEASADGKLWTPLSGVHTSTAYGANRQLPADSPGYDGIRSDWVAESMDLTPWCGLDSVHLRFNFQSDNSVVLDGWLVDSIKVFAWRASASDIEQIPSILSLSQNSPNPFVSSTRLMVALSHPSRVRIVLHDALGRFVCALVNEEMNAGEHTLILDRPLPPGIYLCTAEATGFASRYTATRKLVKLR